MAWLSRNDFTGADFVQASDLNNLHDDQVTWGGDVNGGGHTLSNVILAGVTTQGGAPGVSSFNTRTGAVMPQLGDYTAAMVGAVPATVQVIAGSGLSGGGSLTGNVTLTAQMLSFNTRVGAITLTPADITGAMGVVQARKISTGAGLQGGGNLAGDLTLSVVPGDPTQQVQFLQAGAAVGTRHGVNFISGANVTVAVADNSTAGRVDVTISSTGGGSGMVDPTTTKGDIIVRGPSITSRLAVGADGQVLTADSTQALGMRWVAASGSGDVTTVFGRTGAVSAGTGDYTAAQVTNAVDRSQTYSDPAWLTGLAWAKILGVPAFLADPTTTKGDLIVHGAATSRLPVGGDGTILVADSTQALGMRWGVSPSAVPGGQFAGDLLVWGQTGGWGLLSAAGQPAAVGNVLTVQSIGASTKLAWQAPPPPQPSSFYVNGTLIHTSFGLNIIAGNNTTVNGVLDGGGARVNVMVTAGGPASGLADPTTTKGDLIARSSSQVTRLPIGTDGTVLMADSTQTLGMKWATVSGGGGGGAQTPWTSNIDAAGYTLSNIPAIQAPPSENLILNAPGVGASISLQVDGTTMATINPSAGLIAWGPIIANANPGNNAPPVLTLAGSDTAQWSITGTSSPTTPGTNLLTFQCLDETAAIYVMNDLGYFGVGVAAPHYTVDVAGDVNVSGIYRIAGTPLAAVQVVNAVDQTETYADPAWITSLSWTKITGAPSAISMQTPWLTVIDAAGFDLINAGTLQVTDTGISGQFFADSDSGRVELYTDRTFSITAMESANFNVQNQIVFAHNNGFIVQGGGGASEQMRLTSAGLLGVGKPAPAYKVDVNGDVNVSGAYRVNGVAISTSQTPWTQDINAASHNLVNVGNIGIGTSTPAVLLSVRAVNSGIAPFAGTRVFVESSGSHAYVETATAGTADGAGYLFSAGFSASSYIVDLGTSWNFGTNIAKPFVFTSTAGEWLRITATGNVGIGNAAPVTKLQVTKASAAFAPNSQTVLFIENAAAGPAYFEAACGGVGPGCGLIMSSGSGATSYIADTGTLMSLSSGLMPLVLNAGGSERMRITAGGNVGIGTTNPQRPLEVTATGAGIAARFGNSQANIDVGAYDGAYNGVIINSANWGISLQAGGVTRMVVDTSGRIGVGLTPATFQLQATGNLGATPQANLHVSLGVDPSAYAASNVTGVSLWYDTTNNCARLDAITGGVAWRNIALAARANTGNVGIGTAAPQTLLSVIPGTDPGTPQAAASFSIGETSNNPQYRLQLGYFHDTSAYKGVIRSIHANSEGASALILNPDGGNVGIGMTNPAAMLHVNGAAKFGPGFAGSPGDIGVARISAPTTGVIYFGGGSNYIYYDGSQFQLQGHCLVNGNVNVAGGYFVNGVPLATGAISTIASPSRALNTVYQNTTGKTLYVSVACTIPGGANISSLVGTANPPGTTAGLTGGGGWGTLFFIVLAAYFYQVQTGGAVSTLYSWTEWN